MRPVGLGVGAGDIALAVLIGAARFPIIVVLCALDLPGTLAWPTGTGRCLSLQRFDGQADSKRQVLTFFLQFRLAVNGRFGKALAWCVLECWNSRLESPGTACSLGRSQSRVTFSVRYSNPRITRLGRVPYISGGVLVL